MLIEVLDKAALKQIEQIARITWHEHYGPLIGEEQVNYMLNKFLTVDIMAEQIERNNYRYYLIKEDNSGTAMGFLALQWGKDALFLSKIYLLKEFRGKGYASQAFDFTEQKARESGLKKVWLTVNRHNTNSYHVYLKRGFVVAREEVTDIGEGYVMDDYIMELSVKQ